MENLTAPPAELIGGLGEHFASQWLKEQGYEIRTFWSLRLKLDLEKKKPISQDELRVRWIPSLEARILSLDKRLPEAEKISNPTKKVKNWIEQERPHLKMMKHALNDLKNGKPIEDISEYPEDYHGPRRLWPLETYTDPETHDFLGSHIHHFLEYIDECNTLAKEHLGGTMLPDFVAKRENDFYLVEVKANEAELAPLQRRALELAAKYDFKTKIIRVHLKLEGHCEEEPISKRPRSSP